MQNEAFSSSGVGEVSAFLLKHHIRQAVKGEVQRFAPALGDRAKIEIVRFKAAEYTQIKRVFNVDLHVDRRAYRQVCFQSGIKAHIWIIGAYKNWSAVFGFAFWKYGVSSSASTKLPSG